MKKGFLKKYLNWRSEWKLPASYIFFFVLMFFLLGEQLPALPLYILGPGNAGEGPDKLHILDLPLPDAAHRPLFYLLFGFLSWLLFRFLSWPVVWISAFVMWAVFHWFLPEQGASPYASLAISVFIGVGIFLLVPYFMYRAVDRKWGAKGRRNAILIVVGLNILIFAFFVLQIYGLHNSYSGYMP